MAKDKINMPSSGAGLTSFYEESESKIKISPYMVIGAIVVIAIVTILLNNI